MVGVAAAGGVTEIVELFVSWPRPPMNYQLGMSEMTDSYPSGNVTATTALAVTTALVGTTGAARPVRRWAIGLAAMISPLAAVVRLYLGVHLCTDALAAFAVAAAASSVMPSAADAALGEIRRHRDGRLPDWFAPSPQPHSERCPEPCTLTQLAAPEPRLGSVRYLRSPCTSGSSRSWPPRWERPPPTM
ncbi:phosphatase PAP2 family protein [uncultured Gordonia sp.]|uniref:phosphatase PAP2 family protein n=1 Tax=uncultured Gordonia sp. TaxID=198437 RepID=UPI00338D507D